MLKRPCLLKSKFHTFNDGSRPTPPGATGVVQMSLESPEGRRAKRGIMPSFSVVNGFLCFQLLLSLRRGRVWHKRG